LAEADLQSWDATNFTLNWTTNNATAYVIHFIAIGGPAVSAKVVPWTMGTTTGNKSVTGVGFTPDVVLHAHVGPGFTFAPPTSAPDARGGRGVRERGGGKGANALRSLTGVPSDPQGGQQRDACLYGFGAGLVVSKRASFVSMDADGFTVNFTTADTNAGQVVSLALKGVAAKAGSFLKSTTVPPASAFVQGKENRSTANLTSFTA